MTNLTNDETSMGDVLRDGERVGLRFVRRFAHPVERVWSAITESDQLQFWMPCDIVGERLAGAEIKLPFWPAHVERYQLDETPTGRIEVWDPPAVFQWTWGGDSLRFELNRTDGGTTMTFTTWLESPDLEGASNAGSGYHVCLDHLRVLLNTGSAPPLVEGEEAARRLQPEYAERLGAELAG
jgi:uncharacterized protein YndB with AHSA1/START domain